MTEPRKTFHIIGTPKPVVEPAIVAKGATFERGDLVQHVKTGAHYRIQRVWRDSRANRLSIDGWQLQARRIVLGDDFTSGYRNWRFHKQRKIVRLAAGNLTHVGRPMGFKS